ncbi:MAG TPA: nuclear transport factor 2 family protein [Pyrinomonadaceae bacterium]|nr:nuclear transport factor 2 family protein [Pyrinomonadaceae bacterium]
MKKFAIIGFIIFTLAFTAFGQKGKAAKVDPAKAVRETFDRLVEGIKQADAEKVMSVYDKSERILFFNNNGSATLGWEEMKKQRENLYANTKDVTLDITGLRVEMLSPTSAYVSCKWKQTQTYKDKLEDASGRMTVVFKLIGKDWKAVHLHTSPDNPPAARPVFPSEREN